MANGRVNVASWLLHVLVWDGALPAVMIFTPALVKLALPNNRGAVELTAVILPVTAFLVRFYVGRRHIGSNSCDPLMQSVQLVIFCIGIFVLVLIDAAFALSHIMPKGAFSESDLVLGAVLGGAYLCAMTIAMYPGRREELESEWFDEDPPF